MTVEQQVLEKLRELPPQKQEEVLVFVSRLQEKSGNGPRRSLVRSLVGPEVIYLAERERLPLTALQSLENALGDPMGSMVIAPLDAAAAETVQ